MTWDWTIDGWIILVGVLSACSCALLGNFLVLRRLSLMGDAISHAVLPGLALAFMLTNSRAAWPMFVGAVVVGALTALLTQAITHFGRVEQGAAMGVVFSVLFAVGLVLIRRAADHVDLDPGCVLYGNIVQIPLDALVEVVPPAVVNLTIVLVLNALFVGLFYKELKISSFDPELATTLGINASVMHYALMVMVAVTTVANFEAVGSILVIAMLIVPAVTAHLLTDRLSVMIALSLIVALISAIAGHITAAFGPEYIGYSGSANTAAMMAVVGGACLFLVVMFSPSHGVFGRYFRRVRLSLSIVEQDVLGLLYRWREMHAERPETPLRYDDLLDAIGRGALLRWALRRLSRQGAVSDRDEGFALTGLGTSRAANVVGSHRLWEAYLAKHFDLADDHLHAPAERMEHYISPSIRDELRAQLPDSTHDPHGKPIPQDDQG